MLKDLERYLSAGKPIEIIYVDRNKHFTKRRIKLKEISGEVVKAYCYARHATRIFKVENILAAVSVMR